MIKLLSFFFMLALCAPAWAVEVDAINGIAVSNLKAINGIAVSNLKAWNGFAIASGTCTLYIAAPTTGTYQVSIASLTARRYVGVVMDDGASGSICQVDVESYGYNGDPTALDYYCEIWLLDGSNQLATMVGRSAGVDGVAKASHLYSFIFSTSADYDCTGANKYGVAIKAIASGADPATAPSYSATNNIIMRYADEADAVTGFEGIYQWTGTGDAPFAVTAYDAEDDPWITIHTKQ